MYLQTGSMPHQLTVDSTPDKNVNLSKYSTKSGIRLGLIMTQDVNHRCKKKENRYAKSCSSEGI